MLDVQKVSVICIMIFNALMMAFDLIPYEYVKRTNKKDKEETTEIEEANANAHLDWENCN